MGEIMIDKEAIEQAFVVHYAIGFLGTISVALFLYFYLADPNQKLSISKTLLGVIFIPSIVGIVAGSAWYIANGQWDGPSVPIGVVFLACAIVGASFGSLVYLLLRIRNG